MKLRNGKLIICIAALMSLQSCKEPFAKYSPQKNPITHPDPDKIVNIKSEPSAAQIQELHAELGIDMVGIYTPVNESGTLLEIDIFSKVSPEGLYSKAGGKYGDILLDKRLWGWGFYNFLLANKGRTVEFEVVNEDDDGVDLERRPKRLLKIEIPGN